MSDESPEGWIPGIDMFSEAVISEGASRLMRSIDAQEYVGTRHHIVPKFVLARFANSREQVFVHGRTPDGETNVSGVRSIGDLAVRDFYTVLDDDGQPEASFEALLGEVEKVAARVMRRHLDNPFVVPRPFRSDERLAMDGLVAFQAVRGHRPRRIAEIIADYQTKLLNPGGLSPLELEQVEFGPHQNELVHLSMKSASKVAWHLSKRAVFLVRLDRPLLVIGDEPVLLVSDDETEPFSEAELSDYPRRVSFADVEPENLIQFANSSGVGIADAAAIVMPVSPRVALVYDRPGSAQALRSAVAHEGAAADVFAANVNDMVLANASQWVAGHPEHHGLRDLRLPRARPSVTVIDGGSPMSKRLRGNRRQAARRLRKTFP